MGMSKEEFVQGIVNAQKRRREEELRKAKEKEQDFIEYLVHRNRKYAKKNR